MVHPNQIKSLIESWSINEEKTKQKQFLRDDPIGEIAISPTLASSTLNGNFKQIGRYNGKKKQNSVTKSQADLFFINDHHLPSRVN